VVTGGGDFVGRDKIVLTEETAYDVRGLPNPYPGLESYTYEKRAAFAGREAAVQAAAGRITDPAGRQVLTFITGVSGSGKSSFAQAGLLPALEEYYAARDRRARLAVFRPSGNPLALLGDALAQLGLPEPVQAASIGLTPPDFARLLSESTPAGQVNLLVIDQFEELFSQSPPEKSQQLIDILENLPPFEQVHSHLLATLRSDYLDELFNHPALWQIAVQQGVELRAMSVTELRSAILGPLEARAQTDERFQRARFEPGLLAELAEEAAAEPSYLPLLQVSLQELWAGGSLKLERYHGLAQAIEQRAEKVYASRDYDQPVPVQARPSDEQKELLALLVDLVNISLDDDPRRDVRRRRPKDVLEKSSPLRRGLIDDLVAARLLSAGLEKGSDGPVETVDIIHEAVLQKWERLREAIGEQRELLRRRARFEQELSAWLVHDRSDEYLLSGAHLKEARLLGRSNDIVLQSKDALDFVQRSDRGWSALQRGPILQRLQLLILAGGAPGFALAFGITYFSQIVAPFLFSFLLLIELLLGLIGAAIYSLGIVLPIPRKPDLKRSLLALAGGLSGALGFALVLLLSATASGELSSWLLILAEGLLWGFVSGAGVVWALISGRPAWSTWSLVGLASGLALLLGEAFGHAYLRPGIGGGTLAVWQTFLAGAVVPLAMLLAVRLGRIKETFTNLLAP
ncbi:MAG TPA: hypothetical protein VI776_06685, partial [Anaerolineales bacterium]|nr:hypothetical protein [Anaerolineales bacterium]